MSNVQKQKPSRTCTKAYLSYSSFRPYLASDFNQRCGYCDDPDTYYEQQVGFHIDHFKPKSKFPNLKISYLNLVYSCPYCNRAKSNKWQKVNGFIDPCSKDYEKHLKRDNKGKIKAKTLRGKYIVNNLGLYSKRHELIWNLAKLKEQKQQLRKIQTNNADELNALRQFKKIQDEIDSYVYSLGGV
ncbi:HNH endonuclease [Bathymodiolus thermophilus thioautotrophic gill symbiont]|uniref:HNH nuclease domain-containing protein n=1 Tax=Bathymodiolus thermophilus thioautotrophic gill symbiont TaxID=2360 RepID=A0A1J5TWB6_9GAMM|nr:HNH endonuclease [Bathymodiolus thermophilus thioautotrophic gill symbiont]OIR24484.1 hypothetical protein BGC33_10685 [Bathymodiolus thermophilus thioautotrophic gill symbiont]